MVGRVGFAPTTPSMSMQYSTIELTALKLIEIFYRLFARSLFLFLNILKFIFDA